LPAETKTVVEQTRIGVPDESLDSYLFDCNHAGSLLEPLKAGTCF